MNEQGEVVFRRTAFVSFPEKCVLCCSDSVVDKLSFDYGNHTLEETGTAGKVGDVIGKGLGGMVGGIIGSAVGSSVKSKWEVKVHSVQVPFCRACRDKLQESDVLAMSTVKDVQAPPILDNPAFHKENKGDQVVLRFTNPAFAGLFLSANQGRACRTLGESQQKAKAQDIGMWIMFAIIGIPVAIVITLLITRGMDILFKLGR